MMPISRPLRRLLPLLPIGAGWLAILGNSPPPDLERSITGQTGSTTITLTGPAELQVVQATLSGPVRRATLWMDGQMMDEIVCIDGTDCISRISLPAEEGNRYPGAAACHRVEFDGGAAQDGARADSDARAEPDATVLADAAETGDATGASSGDAHGAVANPPSDASPLLPEPRVPMFTPDLVQCEGTGIIRSTKGYSGDWGGSHDFRLEVETAAGALSRVDYHIESIPPKGYFGC
jgi:hypothetical protein